MKNLASARRFGYGTNANSFINPNAVEQSLDASRDSVFFHEPLMNSQLALARGRVKLHLRRLGST